MPVQVTVMYPWDAQFKLDYYMSTHMPLVDKHWKQYGLQKWEVLKFNGGPDGSPVPYGMQATLHWNNLEDFQKAVGSESAGIVMGDIPNFSDKQPVISVSDVVGTS